MDFRKWGGTEFDQRMTGQELRDRRRALRYTQGALAQILGISRRTLVGWENDETPIHPLTPLALWCIEERKSKRQQLNFFTSGNAWTGEKRKNGAGWIDVDTTAETIERLNAQIIELNDLLRDYRATVC